VPARLQESAEFHMFDEARPQRGPVDHERGRGEMRRRLGTGDWRRQLLGEAQHGAAVGFFTRVQRDVPTQQSDERFFLNHSY
jgi:hypothetical protein